jgi:murein hydrolase activator
MNFNQIKTCLKITWPPCISFLAHWLRLNRKILSTELLFLRFCADFYNHIRSKSERNLGQVIYGQALRVKILPTKRHYGYHVLNYRVSPFFLPALPLFFCFSLLIIGTVHADIDQEKQKISRKIQMQEMNVIRLKEGIQNEKRNIEIAVNKEKSLLGKLEVIDLKLNRQKSKLLSLKQQMARQTVLITAKEKELREVKNKKKELQAHLQKRISSYYKLDKVSLINITFSAKTLPDVLNFHDSFETLLTYDQDVISRFRESINELDRAREALTLEESLLHEFIQRGDKEKELIEKSKEEMEILLLHIRTQASLHKQAIIEIEKEAQKLTSTLAQLKNKEDELNQDFLRAKGKLPLPVDGNIITRFNQETTNQLGISKKSKGIAISATNGTPVNAIFKGKVVYAGYLRGHGNTIVVDHGHQYYSIISRVESILVKKGATIPQGETIGMAGDTAMIIDDGVQLEIRKGSKAQDPLKWLDSEQVKFDKN